MYQPDHQKQHICNVISHFHMCFRAAVPDNKNMLASKHTVYKQINLLLFDNGNAKYY